MPDGLRAAETAFVHLCLAKMATVDTTPTSSPSTVAFLIDAIIPTEEIF